MRQDQAFPSRYLKESDLQGREVTVTIDHVDTEKIGDEEKVICYFKGKDKGFVVNKTCFSAIVKATGQPDTDDWDGQRITLYPTETEFKGETVPCIRVRLRTAQPQGQAAAAAQRQPPPPEPDYADEEIPF